jgi:hypothetical protein
MGLSQTLGRLTQLRQLKLTFGGARQCTKVLDYPMALTPLTTLTNLYVFFGWLDTGDVRALLVLTGLRVLTLHYSCLTDDIVPELRALTNLNTLELGDSGMTPAPSTLAPLINALNPFREARGWQPLYAGHGPCAYRTGGQPRQSYVQRNGAYIL